MLKEQIAIAKEIDRVNVKIEQLEQDILAQDSRTKKVFLMIQKRQAKLEEDQSIRKKLSQHIIQSEKNLDQSDKDLQSIASQKNSILTQQQFEKLQANEQKISSQMEKQNELILDLMLQKEELDQTIIDHRSFIAGAHESIKEIKAESDIESFDYKKLKKSYLDHIESLKEGLTMQAKNVLLKTLSVMPPRSIITRVDKNNTCESCGYIHPSIYINDKDLKSCLSCSRIFSF